MWYRIAAMAALALLAGGCTQTLTDMAEQAPVNWSAGAPKRVVVIDPDVELSELTMGGVSEIRADWTRTGKDYLRKDIAQTLAAKQIETVDAAGLTDPHEVQLVKLHQAVGEAIVLDRLSPLPTKEKNFDWTLGPGASALRDHYHGDYALFVVVRDSYSSSSRFALQMGLAMLGVGIPGGVQYGFASLVDLRSGRIVWFNQMGNATGSLKEEKSAADAVASLLKGLPL
jgi:hypothetical protein